MAKLKGQQQKLADTEAKVAALEIAHDQSVAEADALHNAVEGTNIRLSRAAQLTATFQGFDTWRNKLQVSWNYFLIFLMLILNDAGIQ